MADRQQDSQDRAGQVHLNRKRLLYTAALAVLVVAWGGRMAEPLIRGWFNSCQVLDQRAERDRRDRQIEDLNEELIYAQTVEGLDVEAKRQFGVGPPQDVLIEVRVKGAEVAKGGPTSLGDRARGCLNRVGGVCAGAVRRVRTVVKYWSGLDALPPAPAGQPETGDSNTGK